MKRGIALLCCLVMLLGIFAGCAKKNDDPEETTSEVVTDITEEGTTDRVLETDDRGFIKDFIPEDKKFGGKELKIIGWKDEGGKKDFNVDYSNGDTIARATFTRNNMVGTRLGLVLNFDLSLLGDNANRADYVAAVEKNMGAGASYDLIACYSQCAANFAMDGYVVDLMKYDEVFNFDMPWWSEDLTKYSMVNEKLYFASGPISTTNMLETFFLAVNTQMIETMQRQDPRDLVSSGDWTMEEFYTLCKDTYVNTNTEALKDAGDTYGFTSVDEVVIDGFFSGNGLRYYETEEDGRLILSPQFKSAKTEALIAELRAKFNTNDFYYGGGNSPIFNAGRAMFMSTTFTVMMAHKESIDKAGFSYGYVPFPKADTDQEEYYSTSGYPFTMWSITTGTVNGEAAAYAMECLASEGYRKVQPVIADHLKNKINDEAKNIEMFNVIMESKTYDMGRIFINAGDWDDCAVAQFRRALKNNTNWITQVTEHEAPLQATIDAINQSFGY